MITQGCYPGATISLQKQKQLHTYTKKKQLSFQEAAIVIVIVIEYDMHNDLTFSENQKYTSYQTSQHSKVTDHNTDSDTTILQYTLTLKLKDARKQG